jgi:hypothetical protein
VQATAYRPSYARTFGYPLIWNVSGTLHTHVLGWKVDLDIGGTANSVNIHEMKVCVSVWVFVWVWMFVWEAGAVSSAGPEVVSVTPRCGV